MRALLPKSGLLLAAWLAMVSAAPALAAASSMPLAFERLEAGSTFGFLARSRSGTVVLRADGFNISLPAGGVARKDAGHRSFADPAPEMRTDRLQVRFLDSLDAAVLSGSEQLPGKVNYLIGNDPAAWRVGLPLFEKVHVTGLYEGIDLVYYGNQRHLEYDFVVQPGADWERIRIQITGAGTVAIDANGDLLISAGATQLRQHAPIAYQIVNGERRSVPACFKLDAHRQTVRFEIRDFDRSLPLVIDPVLSYSSYLGGSGGETGWDIALGNDGAVYVVGDTTSADLPWTANAYRTNYSGSYIGSGGDAFIAKLNSSGAFYDYLTYLGGNGIDAALGIAVDASGNAYLTGVTSSTNFPTFNAISNRISGKPEVIYGSYLYDAFVAKLNPAGSGLVYSTFLGGNGTDQGLAIAVDSSGQACVAGFTQSTNFPCANQLTNRIQGGDDAFVTKLNAAGSAFIYSTYLGGVAGDHAGGIAVDDTGAVFVTGYTGSTNFPVRNAFQPLLNRETNLVLYSDAFVTSLNPSGGIAWSTFLGGNNSEYGNRVVLDASRNVYVAGSAASTNFPVTVSALPTGVRSNNFLPDAFVTRLTSAGALSLSTKFGGLSRDDAMDVAVGVDGRICVAGRTASLLFPTSNVPASISATNRGGLDAFVSVLTPDATGFVFSGYLGGAGDDVAYGIETDPGGNVYLTGQTYSSAFPVQGSGQTNLLGNSDAFLSIFTVEPVLRVMPSGTDILLQWSTYNRGYTLESAPVTSFSFAPLAVTPAVSNGWNQVIVPMTPPGEVFRLRK